MEHVPRWRYKSLDETPLDHGRMLLDELENGLADVAAGRHREARGALADLRRASTNQLSSRRSR